MIKFKKTHRLFAPIRPVFNNTETGEVATDTAESREALSLSDAIKEANDLKAKVRKTIAEVRKLYGVKEDADEKNIDKDVRPSYEECKKMITTIDKYLRLLEIRYISGKGPLELMEKEASLRKKTIKGIDEVLATYRATPKNNVKQPEAPKEPWKPPTGVDAPLPDNYVLPRINDRTKENALMLWNSVINKIRIKKDTGENQRLTEGERWALMLIPTGGSIRRKIGKDTYALDKDAGGRYLRIRRITSTKDSDFSADINMKDFIAVTRPEMPIDENKTYVSDYRGKKEKIYPVWDGAVRPDEAVTAMDRKNNQFEKELAWLKDNKTLPGSRIRLENDGNFYWIVKRADGKLRTEEVNHLKQKTSDARRPIVKTWSKADEAKDNSLSSLYKNTVITRIEANNYESGNEEKLVQTERIKEFEGMAARLASALSIAAAPLNPEEAQIKYNSEKDRKEAMDSYYKELASYESNISAQKGEIFAYLRDNPIQGNLSFKDPKNKVAITLVQTNNERKLIAQGMVTPDTNNGDLTSGGNEVLVRIPAPKEETTKTA